MRPAPTALAEIRTSDPASLSRVVTEAASRLNPGDTISRAEDRETLGLTIPPSLRLHADPVIE
jgi:hypothetical protein